MRGCRDTSRSGWKSVDDGTPIDNRKARGNWCNVNGAGLGERPRVSPVASLPIIDVSVTRCA
jgi:cellulase/cellobiase CelA1